MKLKIAACVIPSELELRRTNSGSNDSPAELDAFMVNINTSALVYAAAKSLNSPTLPHIHELDFGGWNKLFSLTFPDHSEMIARIPMTYSRSPRKLESEVATMIFAREFCDIPAPRVFAWNSSDDNPVGAPYILMSKIKEVEPWEIWRKLDEERRLKLLDTLARHHARFSRPLPFQNIGSLYFAPSLADSSLADFQDPNNFCVGAYAHGPSCVKNRGPILHPESVPKVLKDFWSQYLQCELDMVVARWGPAHDTIIDVGEGPPYDDDDHTLRELMEAAADIQTLIDRVALPDNPRILAPCLVMSDYAFRNIIIDPTTLDVVAFLDWEDVHIMPFILGTQLPEDIRTSGYSLPDPAESYSNELPPPNDEEYLLCLEQLKNKRYSKFYAQRLALHDPRFGGLWKLTEVSLMLQYIVSHGWRSWISEGWRTRSSRYS